MARRAEIIEELKKILDLADTEKRAITEDEETRYNGLETELDQLEADVKVLEDGNARRTKLNQKVEDLKKVQNPPPKMAATYRAEDPKEFKNFGEFFLRLRYQSERQTACRSLQNPRTVHGRWFQRRFHGSDTVYREPAFRVSARGYFPAPGNRDSRR